VQYDSLASEPGSPIFLRNAITTVALQHLLKAINWWAGANPRSPEYWALNKGVFSKATRPNLFNASLVYELSVWIGTKVAEGSRLSLSPP